MHGKATRPIKHCIITTRTWNESNIKEFIDSLKEAPWNVKDSFDNVDDICFVWESLMKSVIEQHFPLKRKRIRKQTHPWLNSEVLRLMRTRDQTHKKAVKSGLTSDWVEYRCLRNKVTSVNRKARRNYFAKKLQENRSNPRKFWNTLHIVLPSKSNRDEIDKLVVGDKELTDKKDIANSLNEFFTTVASTLLASRPSPDLVPCSSEQIYNSTKTLEFHLLYEADVLKALQNLDSTKATGPDKIPAKALKIAAPYISNVITNIFNTSYTNGQYPSAWKIAKVTPIHKGGSKNEHDNQRPISVLPCISKIRESFANSNLQVHAKEVGLISQHQYAYVKHFSTTVALIRAVNAWKLAIDKGQKVVCIFLDLRKAFDIIDHSILFQKLTCYGVNGIELAWLKSYLSNRQQYVVSGGAESQQLNLTHSVPQDSVLGPTFNIHINGIFDGCENREELLYADETEIHTSSKDVSVAEWRVNEDLAHIDVWLDQNGLMSNNKKTAVMLVGSRHSVTNTHDLNIHLGGTVLKQYDHFSYLGVDIDSCLNWSKHVLQVSARIYPKLKQLNRISSFFSRKIIFTDLQTDNLTCPRL